MKIKEINVPTTPDANIEAGMAELSYIPEFQDTPFVIRDSEEALRPLAAQIIKQDMAVQAAQRARVARKAVQATVKPVHAVRQAIQPLAEGIKTELRVTAFDLFNGTNLKAELHHQRKVRRVTRFASEIGILSIEPCAKHRKALQKVEAIL